MLSNHAFYSCQSLTEISIPSVTSIESDAFSFCKALEKVLIPPSVTLIGQSALLSCSFLTEISIPSSITSIND